MQKFYLKADYFQINLKSLSNKLYNCLLYLKKKVNIS
jgi:hypothetical protein